LPEGHTPIKCWPPIVTIYCWHYYARHKKT